MWGASFLWVAFIEYTNKNNFLQCRNAGGGEKVKKLGLEEGLESSLVGARGYSMGICTRSVKGGIVCPLFQKQAG